MKKALYIMLPIIILMVFIIFKPLSSTSIFPANNKDNVSSKDNQKVDLNIDKYNLSSVTSKDSLCGEIWGKPSIIYKVVDPSRTEFIFSVYYKVSTTVLDKVVLRGDVYIQYDEYSGDFNTGIYLISCTHQTVTINSLGKIIKIYKAHNKNLLTIGKKPVLFSFNILAKKYKKFNPRIIVDNNAKVLLMKAEAPQKSVDIPQKNTSYSFYNNGYSVSIKNCCIGTPYTAYDESINYNSMQFNQSLAYDPVVGSFKNNLLGMPIICHFRFNIDLKNSDKNNIKDSTIDIVIKTLR